MNNIIVYCTRKSTEKLLKNLSNFMAIAEYILIFKSYLLSWIKNNQLEICDGREDSIYNNKTIKI